MSDEIDAPIVAANAQNSNAKMIARAFKDTD